MKLKARESLDITIKKLGRSSSQNSIDRRDPLLAIEQEFHHPGRQRSIAAVIGRLGFSRPH